MPEFDHMTDAALNVVARHLLRAALEEYVDNAWEMYPEISQHHFDEVERRATEIAGDWPDKEAYQGAYAHLEQLTEQWAQEHPDEI